ncbi:MAG TPA: hypothetical protein VLQ90_14485 [Pyrinomonadaceae bacterium]|nr:hypothetical protein [Pyrinomonadaceae bacterium]
MRKRMIWMGPVAILGMVIFITIGGEVVMHLWNWNLPALFGWRQITFWQALGLFALCRILFGDLGMRVRGSHRSNSRWRRGESCKPMTPEERERIRQRLQDRSRRTTPLDSNPSA